MPLEGDSVPRGRVRRVRPLAGSAVRAAAGRVVAGFREQAGTVGAVERFHISTAEHYTELLGHSKGVLMKAGQLLSTIDPVTLGAGGFSPYQKALVRLQADAPGMCPVLVHEILEAELGCAVEEFAEFDDRPMAAASIGQVHHAVLRDGRHVAVKIQYPGVAGAIRDDLANAELLVTFLRFAGSALGVKVDVQAVAREAAARIAEEVDYRHEAASIAAFSELYRGHPFIRVPDLVPELSSDRVVTMTYLEGMDWAAAQQADQDLKNRWAETILRFVYGNYRHANLLHADSHPGNYRFNSDGSVGFVDFGCVKVLPEVQRLRLVAQIRAFLEGRKEDMRDLMVLAGYFPADFPLGADELFDWQAELLVGFAETAPQPVTYTPELIGRVIRYASDFRRTSRSIVEMKIPDDYVFFARVHFVVSSVLAGLNATLPARAIADDLDGTVEPVTDLGRQHHAWVRERGLPSALERRTTAP